MSDTTEPNSNSFDDDHAGEFDWTGTETFIHEQPETAVYRNSRGQVVIRQHQNWMAYDEDWYVFFSPEFVPALIAELENYLKSIGQNRASSKPERDSVTARDSVTSPRDKTAAQRKRRQRQRERERQDADAQEKPLL
jgi:hypothetical protein